MGENMLVNTKEMLLKAKQNKYAVPHFNINNLEWTRFILEEAQRLNTPVILGVSEGALRYMGGAKTIVGMVKGLIDELFITVDIALHIDHGQSFETCKRAIDAGFTSVMIDGSKYSIEQNIEETKKVVEYAHQHNVTVEAELGLIGGEEDGVANATGFTNLKDCEYFIKNVEIDSLAPALGSVHGLYKGEPKLDYETMKEINENIEVPLVLHGGSGLDNEKITEAINCGISKININTELQIAWSNAVREFLDNDKKVYDPRKFIKSGETAMKKVIEEKIVLFSNNR